MLSPFRMVCGNFILPEPASYVFFYAFFNLRNLLYIILNTAINRKYLLKYMLSDAFNLQVATAMSSRVKMPKINQDELSKILIPIPPMQEQERIVSKIEELFDKITLI